MTQTTTNSSLDRDELVDGLFTATVGTLELFGVYLGHRLGLYPALAEHADMTADELAAATGVAPRYAREWLEQQGVGGFLAVAAGDVGERRFSLPAAHRDVLADEENLAYVAPFALLVAGIGQALPEVVDAYRTRRGVPWAVYGADARDGQAAINRPAFLQEMEAWMASMPDVHARLQADPPARVADLGCGADWSTIGLARAFPKAEVTGFDIDGASIADAARNATRAGVADCVTFAVHDAADPVPRARVHLRGAPRHASAGGGAGGGESGSDSRRIGARGRRAGGRRAPRARDPVERMMYGWSIVCCLPTAMVDTPSAATGTVMRTEVLRRYAKDAGFDAVDVLPVDNELFRFYRLRT